MSIGVRLFDYQGKDDEHGEPIYKETCRIWLGDGLIHQAGSQFAVDNLLNLYVCAGRVYTDKDGDAWLKVMAGTWRASYSYLELFDPDTNETIHPPEHVSDEKYWRWVNGDE